MANGDRRLSTTAASAGSRLIALVCYDYANDTSFLSLFFAWNDFSSLLARVRMFWASGIYFLGEFLLNVR